MNNFSTTLWGEILKTLDKQFKSVLDKNIIALCKAEYSYDKKELKIFAINTYAEKTLNKYKKNIKKTVNDIMFSDNIVSFELMEKDFKKTKHILSKREPSAVVVTGTVYERFSFENFVSADDNQFAYKTSLSAAMSPGTYNPLVVYSEQAGVGKTHLLHSVANYIKTNKTNKKILVNTGRGFLQEYIQNIQDKNYTKLKKTYLANDILIIDNIDDLSSKTKTQEEFLSITEDFVKKNKQVVLSLRTHPVNLKNFNPSLKDIISGGTVAEIRGASFKLAKKIIFEKFKKEQFSIKEEIIEEILTLFNFSSIREIEGVVKSVVAYFSLSQKKINKANIHDMFSSIKNRTSSTKEEKLINAICSYYKIQEADLLSKNRSKNISYARQVAMYILRTELNIKLKRVAEVFSKKSHATVIHAIDKLSKEIKTNETLFIDINNIKRRIK